MATSWYYICSLEHIEKIEGLILRNYDDGGGTCIVS